MISKSPEKLQKKKIPVNCKQIMLSEKLKEQEIKLDESRLIATGNKGWCTVLANHPIIEGTYYCEIDIKSLPNSVQLPFENVQPHVRVGIATKEMNFECPLGYHPNSYAYRDVNGGIYYNKLELPYGKPFGRGDTIGILIHMNFPEPDFTEEDYQLQIELQKQKNPNSDILFNPNVILKEEEIVQMANQVQDVKEEDEFYQEQILSLQQQLQLKKELSTVSLRKDSFLSRNQESSMNYDMMEIEEEEDDEDQKLAKINEKSCVYFFVNGECQGKAIENLPQDFYFVGVSLYMKAQVEFNFGPNFKFPIFEAASLGNPNIFEISSYSDVAKNIPPYKGMQSDFFQNQ